MSTNPRESIIIRKPSPIRRPINNISPGRMTERFLRAPRSFARRIFIESASHPARGQSIISDVYKEASNESPI